MKAHALAESEIKQDEQCRLLPYEDTAGNLTIGWGYNLENGIPQEIADALFRIKFDAAYEHCKSYSYWEQLSAHRQSVLLNMCYNLGHAGFDGFRRMHSALRVFDYVQASLEILDSKAARTNAGLAKRYSDLANTMREG